jgi:hypothetical protein
MKRIADRCPDLQNNFATKVSSMLLLLVSSYYNDADDFPSRKSYTTALV